VPSIRPRRKPKGYGGEGHETIGTDVVALLEAVLMPELVLGKDLVTSLRSLDRAGWYPIELLLGPLERLDAVLGPASLRKIGAELFRLSHEGAFRTEVKSARDAVYGIDTLYRRANRGRDIGGWRVLSFEPGVAKLEKTTPHHCVMEEGILEACFAALGIPIVLYQTRCLRKGDDLCEFHVRSHVSDWRWTGRN
jgi:hypothetical protein